jgi:hypothetical protein
VCCVFVCGVCVCGVCAFACGWPRNRVPKYSLHVYRTFRGTVVVVKLCDLQGALVRVAEIGEVMEADLGLDLDRVLDGAVCVRVVADSEDGEPLVGKGWALGVSLCCRWRSAHFWTHL